MKIIKKTHFLIFLLVICFILLGFNSPILSQQKVEISIMMTSGNAKRWKPLEAKFEQENPHINLQIIDAPNSTNVIEDLYTSAFLLGDSPYDLVYMDIIWLPKFAAAGFLKDLSEFVSEDKLEDFLEDEINAGKYKGRLYRMPFMTNAGMLYYRSDLLEKNGYQPPETFTDLITISENLQKKGLAKWGYVWQGKQYEGLAAMFVEILEGFGAYWINPDTLEVGLDSKQAIASVEFLRSTIEKGISPPGVTTYAEEETRLLFQKGDTVFLRNWPYVTKLASQSDLAGKFNLKPMVHQPGYKSGACLGGDGIGISANTKHPKEAWRVIEFITNKTSQKEFVLKSGTLPTRRSLFNNPEIVAKYPYFPDLLKVVKSSVLRPPIPQYAQASDILQRYLSAAITNTMTPEKAMKLAAEETRRLLKKNNSRFSEST